MARLTTAQVTQFKAEAERMLEQLGATLEDAGAMYPYTLQTYAGPLRISICEDWLACRFDDVRKASGELYSALYGKDERLNHHSGKWNWHGLDCLVPFEQMVAGNLAMEIPE